MQLIIINYLAQIKYLFELVLGTTLEQEALWPHASALPEVLFSAFHTLIKAAHKAISS
jgi:hypothetical protein